MTDYFLSDHLPRAADGSITLPGAPAIHRMHVVVLDAVPAPWWTADDVEAHRHEDHPNIRLTGVWWSESPAGVTLYADDVDYWFTTHPHGYMIMAGDQPVTGGTMDKNVERGEGWHKHAVVPARRARRPPRLRGTIVWASTGIVSPPRVTTLQG